MTEEPRILPCPFCGGTEISWSHDGADFAYVECDTCMACVEHDLADTEAVGKALDKWNTRTPAIADSVGVDTLALSRFYIDMEPKYTPYTLDYFKVCLAELAAFFENNGYEIIRTPPQAATDEG